MKKKIVIIGAGTAGASAFAYLTHYFKEIADVELIASEDIETIGVGEATVGNINVFLESIGLEPEEICLKDSEGSIKYAVHLKDWYKDNHSYFTPIGLIGMDFHDYRLYDISLKEYWLTWCGLKLATENKSPFLKKEYWNKLQLPNVWKEYAYNIDASLFAKKLLEVGEEKGGKRTFGNIVKLVSTQEDTIDHAVLDTGEKVYADFWVDCSGFKRLIKETLDIPMKKFKELGNNRAWATRIPYIDRNAELPYLSGVECQSMNAGWRWQIGLKNRIGTGYVFNNNYISKEDALKEFKNSFEEDRIKDEDCKLIEFETECMERQSGKNWISVGLSSGFVEPLESTSIFFMHNNLVTFASLMVNNKLPKDAQMVAITNWELPNPLEEWHDWSDRKIQVYNEYTLDTFKTTVDYVAAHYAFNQNNKSKYWDDWVINRKKYLEECNKVFDYQNTRLFFSRPAWSLLAVGNELYPEELNNWDLSKMFLFDRQKSDYNNGKFGTPPSVRDVINDRTQTEHLYTNRMYFGIIRMREMVSDKFKKYAYDLIDQYEHFNGEKVANFSERSSYDFLQDANF
tara:strand:- start:2844 stop:4553 length:1710 start_codon:yes stop_codon:yes gene_type:complete